MVKYGSMNLVFKSLRTKILRKADTKRWKNESNLDLLWRQRSSLIAEMIKDGSKVLEFGAGRGELGKYLSESCIYLPSDIVPRGDNTLIIDLNSASLPSLDDVDFDTVVFAGVIEYVVDMARVIDWLSSSTDSFVLSHCCIAANTGFIKRKIEVVRRYSYGWNHSFTESELVNLFDRFGYSLKRKEKWTTNDGNEDIFLFVSASPKTTG